MEQKQSYRYRQEIGSCQGSGWGEEKKIVEKD